MTIRRINFYGGPGAGKSTLAHHVTTIFKKRGCRAEMAREFVKHWTYYNRVPTAWDQVHIFGQQIQEESILLENGIDYVIAECPLVLGAWYAESLDHELGMNLLKLARQFDEEFPAIHIYLDRGNLEFDPVGRFSVHSTEKIEAMDSSLYKFVSDYVGTEQLEIISSPFREWEVNRVLAKIVLSNASA